jgi:hypothetical protein
MGLLLLLLLLLPLPDIVHAPIRERSAVVQSLDVAMVSASDALALAALVMSRSDSSTSLGDVAFTNRSINNATDTPFPVISA